MSAGYTKIFTGMLDSTVWQLSKEARLLWITLLLKKDRKQMIRAPIPGLAHAARLTIDETEAALKELSSPDKYSQSREHEGRRILRMEDGWWVVNGEKYRDLLTPEDRRAYKAQKQREYRAKKKSGGPTQGERVFQKQVEEGKVDLNGEPTI